MEFIYQLLPENILYALGWMVVHSFWQAFIAALLLSAYLLGWQKTDSRKRYIAGNTALASILVAAVVTFFILLKNHSPAFEQGDAVFSYEGRLLGWVLEERPSSAFSEYFNENMPLIVTVWLVGLVFFLLKMVGGLIYIQRLKHRYVTPLSRPWQEMLGALAGELSLYRHISLAESALVKVPMVIGWLKPVILMPIGAVNSLTTEQVEAILAHELAHIFRHDYLLNLLQSIIEILFYFNPAVWWISSMVRTERENCCDDLAVRLCGSSLTYAKALVSLQELHEAAPAFAMPFSKNKHQLFTRIQRILQPSQNKSNVMEKLSATLLLLAAILMLSVQANTPFTNLIDRVISSGDAVHEISYTRVEPSFLYVDTDTVPGKHETHIHRKTDDEEVEMFMKDGKITNLIINGEEIPKERYGEYEALTEELLEDVENIPEPPAPPAPQAPPSPPAPGWHPVPPAPPAPPAPPVPSSGTRRIITKKDGKGTTFIIEPGDGSDPVRITMKDGKKGKIIINGQEISGLKKGDKTIIVEDMDGVPGPMIWNGRDGKVFALPDVAPLGELHFAPEDWAFHTVPPFMFGDELGVPMPDLRSQGLESARLWEEMAERMKDGNMNQQWLEEMRERMNNDEIILAPHFDMEELRGRLEEERARASEDRARRYEQQQERLKAELERMQERQREQSDRARELQMEQQRLIEERLQREFERQELKLKRNRSNKRLIVNDGSM